MKKLLYSLLTCFLIFTGVRCISPREAGNIGLKPAEIVRSHNTGKDCMTCHKLKVNEKLSFKVAGTVYDGSEKGLQGATIVLYSKSDGSGDPVLSLTSDSKGNFFTVTPVDFRNDLYASVISGTKKIPMDTPVTSGACNSCHGKTEGKVVIP